MMADAFPETPWIHLSNPNDGALDLLAQRHSFHELDVEDCRQTGQVAKVSMAPRYQFVVIKTIQYERQSQELSFTDFDLFVMPDLLVTVAEGSTSVVARARDLLPHEPEFHNAPGIAYLLIDATVDQYLPVLDEVGGLIEDIEEEVLARPEPAVLQKIFRLKRLLIEFRRNTTAMREVVNHLMRTTRSDGGGELVLADRRRRSEDLTDSSRPSPHVNLYPYYRDVYDHLVRALDFIETYRDLVSGAMDIYLSAVANRTNEVMKRLTIYGTISIPVLAVTGFYGMNVPLPIQQWPFAWHWVLGVMGVSIGLLLLLFWRKGWM